MSAFTEVVGMPGVVGALQAAAVAPVHAYLLLGDGGAGLQVARSFAAALLCADGGCGECRDCRLALAGEHPDALTYIPEGAFLQKGDGEEIIRLALRSPTEGTRKVLVLAEMHRVQAVGPMLLKTIEEPPVSTVFIVLADHVPPELVTIASRCVRIELPPLGDDVITGVLAAGGVAPDVAARAAAASLGSVERARVLATDPGLGRRHELWASLPRRLDGTGASVVVAVEEVRAAIDESMAPLLAAQQVEVDALEARVAEYGERGSGRKQLVESHKRQVRRHRAQELRFGLATLAGRYREALAGGASADVVAALTAVDRAALALTRNPNEGLLLQDLFLRVPPLA